MHNNSYDIPVAKAFIYNGSSFLYDTYSNNIIKVSQEQYYEICQLLELGIENYKKRNLSTPSYLSIIQLINKGILQPPFVEKIYNPITPYVKCLLNSHVHDLSLQVTRECNFKCRYCLYASHSGVERTHELKYMSWDTAKKSIDFLYDHSSSADSIHISFYGGEPFLNFKLIKDVVNYVENRFFSKKIEYGVTINGSILSDEIIDFIIEHNFQLTISLDGPKETQDIHRKFRSDGKGTFDTVFRNIMKLKRKSQLYFDNSVSFIPVYFEDESYDKVLNFFADIGVAYEKALPQKATLNGVDYINSHISLAYATNTDDNELDKKFFREIYADKNPLPTIWHHSGPCQPAITRLFVDVNGIFYPCEKILENPSLSIGSLITGLDQDKIASFMNIGSLTAEDCRKCWAFRFCNLCVAHCVDTDKNKLTGEIKKNSCVFVKDRALKQMKQYIIDNGKGEQ